MTAILGPSGWSRTHPAGCNGSRLSKLRSDLQLPFARRTVARSELSAELITGVHAMTQAKFLQEFHPTNNSRTERKRKSLCENFREMAENNSLRIVTVGQVMTGEPFVVHPETPASELVHLFQTKKFRHFLVAEHDVLVGVISDRDVIRLFGLESFPERQEFEKLTAGELMSDKVLTVTADTHLAEAVGILVNKGINCLPVVDGMRPVGVLTSTDLFLSLEQLLVALPS